MEEHDVNLVMSSSYVIGVLLHSLSVILQVLEGSWVMGRHKYTGTGNYSFSVFKERRLSFYFTVLFIHFMHLKTCFSATTCKTWGKKKIKNYLCSFKPRYGSVDHQSQAAELFEWKG